MAIHLRSVLIGGTTIVLLQVGAEAVHITHRIVKSGHYFIVAVASDPGGVGAAQDRAS